MRFFQQNWGLLLKKVCVAIKLFFQDGNLPDDFNTETIVLISKANDPKRFWDLFLYAMSFTRSFQNA
jgi:hypothetical protein